MAKDLKKFLMRFMGEPIVILHDRYWYRGIVKKVTNECVILSDPYAVTDSGIPTETASQFEMPIQSDVMIPFASIEVACQLPWAFNGYAEKDKNRT